MYSANDQEVTAKTYVEEMISRGAKRTSVVLVDPQLKHCINKEKALQLHLSKLMTRAGDLLEPAKNLGNNDVKIEIESLQKELKKAQKSLVNAMAKKGFHDDTEIGMEVTLDSKQYTKEELRQLENLLHSTVSEIKKITDAAFNACMALAKENNWHLENPEDQNSALFLAPYNGEDNKEKHPVDGSFFNPTADNLAESFLRKAEFTAPRAGAALAGAARCQALDHSDGLFANLNEAVKTSTNDSFKFMCHLVQLPTLRREVQVTDYELRAALTQSKLSWNVCLTPQQQQKVLSPQAVDKILSALNLGCTALYYYSALTEDSYNEWRELFATHYHPLLQEIDDNLLAYFNSCMTWQNTDRHSKLSDMLTTLSNATLEDNKAAKFAKDLVTRELNFVARIRPGLPIHRDLPYTLNTKREHKKTRGSRLKVWVKSLLHKLSSYSWPWKRNRLDQNNNSNAQQPLLQEHEHEQIPPLLKAEHIKEGKAFYTKEEVNVVLREYLVNPNPNRNQAIFADLNFVKAIKEDPALRYGLLSYLTENELNDIKNELNDIKKESSLYKLIVAVYDTERAAPDCREALKNRFHSLNQSYITKNAKQLLLKALFDTYGSNFDTYGSNTEDIIFTDETFISAVKANKELRDILLLGSTPAVISKLDKKSKLYLLIKSVYKIEVDNIGKNEANFEKEFLDQFVNCFDESRKEVNSSSSSSSSSTAFVTAILDNSPPAISRRSSSGSNSSDEDPVGNGCEGEYAKTGQPVKVHPHKIVAHNTTIPPPGAQITSVSQKLTRVGRSN